MAVWSSLSMDCCQASASPRQESLIIPAMDAGSFLKLCEAYGGENMTDSKPCFTCLRQKFDRWLWCLSVSVILSRLVTPIHHLRWRSMFFVPSHGGV